jgi:hypothetical protein
MNSQVSSNLSFAAKQRLLTRPNKFRFLNQLNQFKSNYIAVAEVLNEKLGIPMFPLSTEGGKITSMMLDPADLSVQISSSNLVGSNVVITLAEDKGELFRLNFTVGNDGGMKKGIVVARTTNTITIAPLEGQTLAAADWASPGFVTEMVQLVPNRYSNQVEGRTVMPRLIEDLMPIYRTNRYMARRDYFTSNFVQEAYAAAASGDFGPIESALVKLQLNDMAEDMMLQIESDAIFGEIGVQNLNNNDGNTPRGFIQAVNERGGIGYDVNTPINFNKHKDIIKEIFSNYNGVQQEIICLAGASYIDRVQDGGQQYKVTAGTDSVLAGSGLSFTTVETIFGRITYVPLFLFNNPYRFKGVSALTGNRRLSEAALYISVTTLKDAQGNSVAPIQKWYGNYGGNGPGIFSTTTGGIIDSTGKFKMESASQLDGITLGSICEESHVIANAQMCGYYMLNS